MQLRFQGANKESNIVFKAVSARLGGVKIARAENRADRV